MEAIRYWGLKSSVGAMGGRLMLRLLPFFAAIGLAFLAVTAEAQFQPPSSEELKMTAEPKAPGAAAIYLYREEKVSDNEHYHSFYARIKVLTEKGKELATVEVPYVKGEGTIREIKARTIHADGTVIPLDVKPADLVEVKVGKLQLNKVVFTLPSVEVGSILEYKWELHYSDETLSSPDWEIRQPYFVRKAHYAFSPVSLYRNNVTDGKGRAASRLLYTYLLPEGDQVAKEPFWGNYTVDVADVPAIPKEEYMPPLKAWIYGVTFYYSPFSSKEEFWQHEGGDWSKRVNHFAEESKGLKEAVGQLVSPGDSQEAKARKLYDAVMVLENTDYTRRRSKAELKQLHEREVKVAEDVWKQRSGDSREIALLYLAMARIAGLKADALLVSNRDQEIFNEHLLSMNQLDDTLVTVSISGQEKVLDPGTRFAGFGDLAWKHLQAGGIRQSEKGVVMATTGLNPYKDASTTRVADVTLGSDGTVKGTVRVTMTGPEALRWRQLAIDNDEDEVKKQFEEEMKKLVPDGVTAELDHFASLTGFHVPLVAEMKISGNMGTVTGRRTFLPGVFFESRSNHPFVAEEKRGVMVDMQYASMVQEDVTYHLPDAFVVESAPTETSIPWVGHAGMQMKSVTSGKSGKDIRVVRRMARDFALLEAKLYPELRDFYQKVATADQQQLVLTAARGVASGSE